GQRSERSVESGIFLTKRRRAWRSRQRRSERFALTTSATPEGRRNGSEGPETCARAVAAGLGDGRCGCARGVGGPRVCAAGHRAPGGGGCDDPGGGGGDGCGAVATLAAREGRACDGVCGDADADGRPADESGAAVVADERVARA